MIPVVPRRVTVHRLAVVLFCVATACRPADDTPARDSAQIARTPDSTPAAPTDSSAIRAASAALVFDPATVKLGDTLGGLRVSRTDVTKAADDMGYVGNVRFEGEVTVSGERMNHPDFPDVKEICMTIDSASATRLPRFPGDGRRRWLCFENRDAAARQLGEAGTRGPLTVVIDHYQTVRHFSDAYDTATLVKVIEEKRDP